MIRIYIKQELFDNKELILEKPQYHYLSKVMRLDNNETFYVFNENNGEWLASLKGKTALILEKVKDNEVSLNDVWLLFAPVKKDNTDFIIQKGTELGVSLFQPVKTEFTNTSKVNRDKMYLNAIEATEQCRRTIVPTVNDIVNIKDMLNSFPKDRVLYFLDEKMLGNTPYEVFSSNSSKKVAFLIGPEGGFSKREQELIRDYNFVESISLPHSILRAETAALSIISAWNTVKGEWAKI